MVCAPVQQHEGLTHICAGWVPVILYALRRLFPNFDDEAKKSGIGIVPYNCNAFYMGIPTFCPPENTFPGHGILPKHPNVPEGKIPEILACSRVSLELLIRRLVKETRPEIRFMRGSVTQLTVMTTTPKAVPHEIISVFVRSDQSQAPVRLSAKLVVGG